MYAIWVVWHTLCKTTHIKKQNRKKLLGRLSVTVKWLTDTEVKMEIIQDVWILLHGCNAIHVQVKIKKCTKTVLCLHSLIGILFCGDANINQKVKNNFIIIPLNYIYFYHFALKPTCSSLPEVIKKW